MWFGCGCSATSINPLAGLAVRRGWVVGCADPDMFIGIKTELVLGADSPNTAQSCAFCWVWEIRLLDVNINSLLLGKRWWGGSELGHSGTSWLFCNVNLSFYLYVSPSAGVWKAQGWKSAVRKYKILSEMWGSALGILTGTLRRLHLARWHQPSALCTAWKDECAFSSLSCLPVQRSAHKVRFTAVLVLHYHYLSVFQGTESGDRNISWVGLSKSHWIVQLCLATR